MKTRLWLLLLVSIVILACMNNCLAEDKTVHLGETGITFKVDSSFDIITKSNKKEYSQDIQDSITSDKEMLVYSSVKGAFSVSYDQGKDLEKYDLSNKKVEDIENNYKDYIGVDAFNDAIGEYNCSVYDSGKYKWIKVEVESINLVFYVTIQGKSRVATLFNRMGYDQNEIESIIDSFSFGTPSLWSQIKGVVGIITSFGYRILGDFGVFIVWSIICSLVIYFICIIAAVLSAVFKKKKD